MPSPAKKRKTNKDATGSIATLDHFFAKQRNGTKPTSEAPKEAPEARTEASSQGNEPASSVEHDAALTDEELARKLQEEWNREDEARIAAAAQPPEPIPDEPESKTNGVKRAHTPEVTLKVPTESPSPSKPPIVPAKSNNFLSLQSSAIGEDAIANSIPFDTAPLSFHPEEYVGKLQDSWAVESGGDATYALLTHCFVLVNSTTSRIKIVDTMTNLLRMIIVSDPSSLLPAVWLATNSIAPPYEELELGLGGSAISKALKKVCGLDNNGLKTLYNKYGDAGDVAFEAKKRQTFTLRKPKPLTIKSIYQSLLRIANSKGTGSVENKQRIVERLVQDTRGAEESRYIVRTLVQHLRIGAVKTTMLIALSRAFLLSRPPDADFPTHSPQELSSLKKEALTEIYSRSEETIKACFARRPNYNDLIPQMLAHGISETLTVSMSLTLHIPLRPMLGSITRDLPEMLKKLGTDNRAFSAEFKYDGQRAQVHCDASGRVSIFSRHLENMTDKYPDLVSLVPQIRGDSVRSFVLEGEVVAVDSETGALRPFQHLANRARKDVKTSDVEVQVCLFSFDLMYLNGEELLERSFRERRGLLRGLFTEIPNRFTWVQNLDASPDEGEKVLDFFKQATENKCEGIMVKVLDNPPEPPPEEKSPPPTSSSTPQTPQKQKGARKPARTPTKTKSKSKAEAGATDIAPEIPAPPTTSSRRKALLATYTPDKRIDSWLKVKKDYDSAAADTLDLVPVGAWHGNGRKAAWWSPILLAVRDPVTGGLEAVTKCMSGFTDKFYKEMRAHYDPDAESQAPEPNPQPDSQTNEEPNDNDEEEEEVIATGRNTLPAQPPSLLYTGPIPDVWFRPHEVWECAFADITISPTYLAAQGLVHPEKGLSTRFPRFLKVREDKSVEEASDSDFLAALYRRQGEAGKGGGVGEEGGEDGEEE